VARLIDRTWEPSVSSGLPRRDRRGCDYRAYLPDPLVGRAFRFTGETAADVADAETAVVRFNERATTLADSEAWGRLLLRAEAIASSHIEGLVVGGRRLLRAEAAGALGEPVDVTAAEILGNIDAMDHAVHHLTGEITVEGLLEVHRLLLADTDRHPYAGRLRDEQNWIGGSGHNPCAAAFVPPPEDEVPRLMEDLCAFASSDTLPAVAQAAVAHAQFETIHPFVDGNGRTGRALVHVILRRRGIAPRAVPPISLVLATRARDYIAGLTAYRYVGPPDAPEAADGVDRWVATFAAATTRAIEDADGFEARLRRLQAVWALRLGTVRAGSATERLLARLPGSPVVTVKLAAHLLDRSPTAAAEAIDRLVGAGILRQANVGRRNRVWEAPEAIDAFTDLERALASPTGDTRTSDPVRSVPARRPDR
jgi:Fic family protein